MSLADEASEYSVHEAASTHAKPSAAPKGWEPGITWQTPGAGIVTSPAQTEPLGDPESGWDPILAVLGLDPETYQIVPPVEMRFDPAAWHRDNQGDDAVTRPVWRYKAQIILRRTAGADPDEVDEWRRIIRSKGPLKRDTPEVGPRSNVVLWSDWQVGKGEGGGTPAIVARVEDAQDEHVRRLKDWRKRHPGEPLNVYILGLADDHEGCDGHYAMQTFQTDRNRRMQSKIVRALKYRHLEALAPVADQIVVMQVGGNHDEERKDGKAYTSFDDNRAIATAEAVFERLSENPARYGHISLYVPEDPLCGVIDVSGVTIAGVHGHQFANGKWVAKAAHDWLSGQIMGADPRETGAVFSEVKILFAGHRHHIVVDEAPGRTFIQAAAMDGGSYWYRSRTGAHSPSGMISTWVGEHYGPRGWGDLEIL